MPGERPLQTREWSDKQASVEREEKGECRERSLRIKQLEGAMIYLSIGGNREKESKLRRVDGKNFPAPQRQDCVLLTAHVNLVTMVHVHGRC
ncbi:hypothetical protein CR201_G0019514 [Pongo abelii]|uniref:Uncharacterized protein n=1 Tax=Pongo abelii TaxID=9601 RepID=A0A2J8VDW1_PONAB|nr:hypothetical protein CR201_G0019514 [Pongo abelii]